MLLGLLLDLVDRLTHLMGSECGGGNGGGGDSGGGDRAGKEIVEEHLDLDGRGGVPTHVRYACISVVGEM